MYFIRPYFGLQYFWIARIQWLRAIGIHGIAGRSLVITPGNEYPSLVAFEFNAIGQLIAHHHFHAVGIERFSSENAVYIPQSRLGKLRFTPNFHGTGILHAHSPMCRID